MAVELFANDVTTTLTAAAAAGDATIAVAAAAPVALRGGQFRIRIDNEIMLVTGTGAAGASPWNVTRGVEGTGPGVAHANGATVEHVFTAAARDADVARSMGFWTSEMQGLLAMTWDPLTGPAYTNGSFGNGEQHTMRVPCPRAIDIVNAHTYIHTAGAGMTLARLAVLSAAGLLLGLSGDLSSAFTTSGFKTAALTAQFGGALLGIGGQSRKDYFHIAIFWLGATTTPRLFLPGTMDANLAQANLAGNDIRKHQATGNTDINTPNAALASTDSQQRFYWVGVS